MISVNVKACGACARAKRRCGRQLPSCERCTRQSLDCIYPPAHSRGSVRAAARLSDHRSPDISIASPFQEPVSYDEDVPALVTRGAVRPAVMVPSPASTPSTGPFLSGCEATYSTPSPSLEDAQSAWFLKPDTWRIVRMSTIPNRPMNTGMIEEYLSAMQSWLEEWSRSGCNTFMHRQLYTSRIPTPIGDAFTTLVAYFHRTPATEQMVFRIIEDRILELVETQGWQAGQHEPLDVMGHLSRVQAMIAYLIIGLFHGNIRLRHVADTNLPLLVSWCQQMLEAAALAASNGQLLHSEMCNALVLISSETATVPLPPQAELQATWGRLGVAEKETALWHAWVVAESVRRAWLTARSVECIYLLLRDRAGICPGGLVFTMRRSVWAADSAFAWAKACAEADVEFLHIWETDRLCVRPNSDAIDEFAKVMIKLNFRTDRASQWVGGGCGG